jgi:glutathione S-transferase
MARSKGKSAPKPRAPIEFVDFETARRAKGLRVVVVSGIPSPWSEAAKAILQIKRIPWVAVRLDQANDAMAEWTGERSGPVAMYADEPPRGRFTDILFLAERLAPEVTLLPHDLAARALVLGLSHEICGEMGLGWCRRNLAVHAGLNGLEGGFAEGVAQYLGRKYGYHPEQALQYRERVIALLQLLSARLVAQHEAESRFFVGDHLTVLDLYSATFMALFAPLPHEHCPMPESVRAVFAWRDDEIEAALDPVLLRHRDHVYERYIGLPLVL